MTKVEVKQWLADRQAGKLRHRTDPSPTAGEIINAVDDPTTLDREYRKAYNRETAKKVARLLAESRTRCDDLDDVLQMTKQFLSVSFIDRPTGLNDPV